LSEEIVIFDIDGRWIDVSEHSLLAEEALKLESVADGWIVGTKLTIPSPSP
jgi:hypothetical protein